MMKRLRNIFSRLQWKLTFSYTLVTSAVAIILVLTVLFVAWAILFNPAFFGYIFENLISGSASELAPYLESSPPDEAGLARWLRDHYENGVLEAGAEDGAIFQSTISDVRYLAVVDAENRLLVAEPSDVLSPPLEDALNASEREAVAAALQGNGDSFVQALPSDQEEYLFGAVPIEGEDNAVRGALFLSARVPEDLTQGPPLGTALLNIIPALLPILLNAAFVGAIFGFVASRGLTRRLRLLSETADAWSRGDFSVFVRDASADEIGQLGRRLNQMAEQLQNLLQTRETLAAVEERNRLARELHDSVKQQIFATSMQVATARALLTEDPEAAAQHLAEAEQLVGQAQKELSGLIQELRPAALADSGLPEALRSYASGWARQNGIQAEIQVQQPRALTVRLEQGLFRVAQEALANVTRHSGANRVIVSLKYEPASVTLSIRDDGRGFDSATGASDGFGLDSMRQRVEDLGGELTIESAPGRGARISACLPVPERGASTG